MARKARRITTRQIAEAAGVSQSTVVNVLNSSSNGRFSTETRQRVMAVASELGYQAEAMRRAIKTPLKNIALIMADQNLFGDHYMCAMLGGISGRAAANGYSLTFCQNPGDISSPEDCWQMVEKILDLGRSGVLDGLLIDKSHVSVEQVEGIEQLRIPYVYVNGRAPAEITDATHTPRAFQQAHMAVINHFTGGELAARHLHQFGHRRVGILGLYPYGERQFAPYRRSAMITAFQTFAEQRNMPLGPDLEKQVALDDPTSVARAVDELLALEEPPTAIFAIDDGLALAAMHYMKSKGLSVPGDVSVMGYGGLPRMLISQPELTTLRAPWREMGAAGMDMLLALINGDRIRRTAEVMNPSLAYGETVGPANETALQVH